MLRYQKRRPQVDLDYIKGISAERCDSGIIEALMQLLERFRIVLTLHYVEEYPVNEIAKLINRTPSAVKMRLQKGRNLLEEKYREEYL